VTSAGSPISESDARRLIRLLGQAASVAGTLNTKRRFVMVGLCKAIQASGWAWAMCDLGRGVAGASRAFAWTGGVERGSDEGLGSELEERMEVHGAKRREALSGATRAWELSEGADCIATVVKATEDGNVASCICVHTDRPEGFTQRQSNLAELMLSRVGWLHKKGGDGEQNAGVWLTPREREVLMLLLTGSSRKQIASKLKISTHTVNGHIKELHRKFSVSSRGELLARFYGTQGDRIRMTGT
jgi:DNA-binding CsgD family transcriptional regulator